MLRTLSARERLQSEIEHDRRIAEYAEVIWNWDSPAGRLRVERRVTFYADCAHLTDGRRVLELGCGTGVFLSKTACRGARIHGLDLSMDLLLKARDRVRGSTSVSLECGDAERLPYPDSVFDSAYGSSVLHHLHVESALREVMRVLRPGGRIAFTEPNLVNPLVYAIFHLPWFKTRYGTSPNEMAFTRFRCARLLRNIGYDHVSVRPFDFLYPSLPAASLPWARRVAVALERVPFVREIAGSLMITARKPAVEHAGA